MHEFIFSHDRRKRIIRHILFWLYWLLYMACTQLRNQSPEVIGMKNFIIYQLAVSLNRLVLQIIFCYVVVYFLIPFYLQKRKYWQFSFLLAFFLFVIYWLTYFDYTYVWFRTYLLISRSVPLFFDPAVVKPLTPFLNKYYIIYSHVHFTGSLVSCSIILIITTFKRWYTKEMENELLIRENATAELQLLKAQVQPHFLFNTLNNIYSLSLDNSPKAANIVNKLSGMVRYMMNEGAESFVTVSKEIQMLLNYIGLEKIRYGDRLHMTIDIKNGGIEDKMIAPLLMIPFVENCFKHGSSKIINKAYINLYIETSDRYLEFRISNSKPALATTQTERKKIGLLNVQKRLQLLYPGKHELVIDSTAGLFSVFMKIKFENENKVK
jgi:sensor histidine kinase YesM